MRSKNTPEQQYGASPKKRAYDTQYRLTHKDEIHTYQVRHRAEMKHEVLAHYSKGEPECARCGITDIDVLSIDHINGNGKAHRKTVGSGYVLYHWLRRNNYPDGFQVLCFNCNIKKHIEGQRLFPENKGG